MLLPLLVAGLLGTGAAGAGALHAQSEASIDYDREQFRYPGGARPDPFRPLVGSTDPGVQIDDLSLRGVIFHPDPGRSVAIIARTGEDRPIRASVGDRIGRVRVTAIRSGSVDVVFEEFGTARRETLTLSRGQAIGASND